MFYLVLSYNASTYRARRSGKGDEWQDKQNPRTEERRKGDKRKKELQVKSKGVIYMHTILIFFSIFSESKLVTTRVRYFGTYVRCATAIIWQETTSGTSGRASINIFRGNKNNNNKHSRGFSLFDVYRWCLGHLQTDSTARGQRSVVKCSLCAPKAYRTDW
jgi:hypothetical protein